MNQDPQLRSRHTTAKLMVAAAAGISAVALALNHAEVNTTDCDMRISDPVSWVACPIVDVGSSIKRAVSDELSVQMRNTP